MDCDVCTQHLKEVVRTERPRKLLEAIKQGFSSKVEGGGGDGSAGEDALKNGGLTAECEICPTTGPASGARAYLESPPPRVVFCANRLGSRPELEEAVVHELVHVYDYAVSGMELSACRALAYSEVRAARFAECSEVNRSFALTYLKKRCVRSTATRSTEGLFPGKGGGCVDEVFDAAYKDESPFDAVVEER